MIYIDFETRSESDLKKAGSYKYSKDSSTEVLCCGLYDAELEKRALVTPEAFRYYIPPPYETYIAHSAEFEIDIWQNQMTPKYGWPVIPLNQWKCTAAKAAAMGLPRSLDGAAKALDLIDQKDAEGHALMLRMSKPRSKWTRTGEGPKWFEYEHELQRLYQYCMQDVLVEKAIDEALPDLSTFEQLIWELTVKLNQRGIRCDAALAATCVELAEQLQTEANLELQRLTNGKIATPNQVAKLTEWCQLPNMSAKTVTEALSTETLSPSIRRILEIRQSFSRSSTKKYQAMLHRLDLKDSRIRDNLLYYGAHTGRWSGSGVQIQNLFKPAFKRELIENFGIPYILTKNLQAIKLIFGDPMTLFASTLRSTLHASPGHDLIGADYSAIEAVVLLWLAGETKALELLRQGKDLYIDMASTIYKTPYNQIAKKQRQLGKLAILSLGFGAGAKNYQKTGAKWNVFIKLPLAERIVKAYRTKYNKIVQYWRRLETLALSAMSGRPNDKFKLEGKYLQLQLVSGRKLSYPYPQVMLNQYEQPILTYAFRSGRVETYGSKLAENEVQATARDITAHGMLTAEEAGYILILTVHDEAVAEVPEDQGSVAEFVRLLCTLPKWAEGCPIRAEGWRGKRYRK